MLRFTTPTGQSSLSSAGTPARTNPAAPKYVNSPTTDLFRKTDLPYGLTTDNIEELRAGADLVIVEGPMDAHAVAAAAAPAKDLRLVAVAPLGTALTAEQLATINGIGPLTDRRVIVALDNDHAGTKAARNALRLLADAGVDNPDAITLPAGQDPAQVLADSGPAALADALTHRRPLVDLVVDDITGYWLGRITPGGWGIEEGFHALQEAAPIIARLPEPNGTGRPNALPPPSGSTRSPSWTPSNNTSRTTRNSSENYNFRNHRNCEPGTPGRGIPTPADTSATRTALTNAIAQLERSVRQLHQPNDTPMDDPGIRLVRDTDRRDSRPDPGPRISR